MNRKQQLQFSLFPEYCIIAIMSCPTLLYLDSKKNIFFFFNISFGIIIVLFQVCCASCIWAKAVNWPVVFFSNAGAFCILDMNQSGTLDRGFNSGTLPANSGRLASLPGTHQPVCYECGCGWFKGNLKCPSAFIWLLYNKAFTLLLRLCSAS
jgi:hypothetical protein